MVVNTAVHGPSLSASKNWLPTEVGDDRQTTTRHFSEEEDDFGQLQEH